MATPSSPTMTSPSRTPTRAAGLSVSTLTTRALELAGGRRGRQNWRFFVSNLSEMAAQHTDQTLAAADGMLERVVADVGKTAPADAADLKAKAGTREMYELLRRRQSDLPQIGVVSLLTTQGELVNFSRTFPTPHIDLADRDYLKAHLASDALGVYLSAPVKNRAAAGRGSVAPARALPLTEIDLDAEPRLVLPWNELNRVLGGGVVAGSLVLVGGGR